MITEEDWELIRGALADVAASDLGDDSDAAQDLMGRIDRGEAQAPVEASKECVANGPSDRDVTDLLHYVAEMVKRQGVRSVLESVHPRRRPPYNEYMYGYDRNDPDQYTYQSMRDIIAQPIDPKAFLKVTTS